MDWTMIGAIGELLGAAGVIASLLYLGRQVQQTRKSDQRARYDGLVNAAAVWTWSIANEEDTASIVFRGLRDLEALTPEERFRFYAAMLSLFRNYEAAVQYSVEGDIHTWGRDSFDHAMGALMGTPGMRAWWVTRREWFAPATQAAVDALIAEADDALLSAHPREEA